MDLNKKNRSGYTIIELSGSLSLANAVALKEVVQQFLENPTKGMILNFRHVRWIDSSGISILVAIHKQLSKSSCYLALSQVCSHHLELFTLTKLDHFLIFTLDDDDAITLLQFIKSQNQPALG